jgi:hypothetical protein
LQVCGLLLSNQEEQIDPIISFNLFFSSESTNVIAKEITPHGLLVFQVLNTLEMYCRFNPTSEEWFC